MLAAGMVVSPGLCAAARFAVVGFAAPFRFISTLRSSTRAFAGRTGCAGCALARFPVFTFPIRSAACVARRPVFPFAIGSIPTLARRSGIRGAFARFPVLAFAVGSFPPSRAVWFQKSPRAVSSPCVPGKVVLHLRALVLVPEEPRAASSPCVPVRSFPTLARWSAGAGGALAWLPVFAFAVRSFSTFAWGLVSKCLAWLPVFAFAVRSFSTFAWGLVSNCPRAVSSLSVRGRVYPHPHVEVGYRRAFARLPVLAFAVWTTACVARRTRFGTAFARFPVFTFPLGRPLASRGGRVSELPSRGFQSLRSRKVYPHLRAAVCWNLNSWVAGR